MIWFFGYLFYPSQYLFVRLEDTPIHMGKFAFDCLIPIALSTFIALLYAFIPEKPDLIGSRGFFSNIAELGNLLAAFFLASLAAVASFNNPDLEKGLRGSPAYILVWDNEFAQKTKRYISRRAYIKKLFGYLSWISILFVISIYIFESFSEIGFLSGLNLIILNTILVFIGLCIFLNITFVSISGIIFLISRLSSDDCGSD